MKTYQLYLENILNALTRAGISFPAKLGSYEELWLVSETLGVFLEINSFLQRVGSGFPIMGFDESITFKTYWNTEFYLEYQGRKSTELSFSLSLDVSVSDEVSIVTSLTEEAEVLVEPLTNFSGITGISSSGFDTYGVTLEEDVDDESYLVENPHITATVSQDVTPKEDYTFSEVTSVSSDGFDVYGVELEEDYEEPTFVEHIEESSTDEVEPLGATEGVIYNEIVGVSADGFDSYGVDLEEDYIEFDLTEAEEFSIETPASSSLENSPIGFDNYGADLEEDDEATLNEINGVSVEDEWVEEIETLDDGVVYADGSEPEYIEESVPLEEDSIWVEESIPVEEESIPPEIELEYIEESIPWKEPTTVVYPQKGAEVEKTVIKPSYPKQVTDTDKVLNFLGGIEKFVMRKVKK